MSFLLILWFAIFLAIIIHESGHYYIARCVGIHLDEFVIGTGPLLYQRQVRLPNMDDYTRQEVRLWPLGGYVLFCEGCYAAAPRIARMWAVLGGIIFNLATYLALLSFAPLVTHLSVADMWAQHVGWAVELLLLPWDTWQELILLLGGTESVNVRRESSMFSSDFVSLYSFFAFVQLSMLINLLPVFGSDGEYVIQYTFENFNRRTQQAIKVSFKVIEANLILMAALVGFGIIAKAFF